MTKFSNNFKTRVETKMVSWDGGKTYNKFTIDTMIEIKLYLSNRRIELDYRLQ